VSPIVVDIPGARILSSSGSGSNGRQHWAAKGGEVADHRVGAAVWTCNAITSARLGYACYPSGRVIDNTVIPVARHGRTHALYPARRVTLTRIHPKGRPIRDEDDNLRAAFKGTKDGVADALGLDDASRNQGGRIEWIYNQIVGPWGIRITIET
jgi:hypothetical protein